MLKDFSKYIRVDDPSDSSNFVLSSKFKETVHFKLVPEAVWDLLHAEFGGTAIRREKDNTNFSYFAPKYKLHHDCCRVLILPPWHEMSAQILEDAKVMKIYYNPSDTFIDLKRKLMKYLQQNGKFG